MDEVRAKRIAAELKGHQVSGWTVCEYINYGKSAVILRATRGSDEAALKIFDPDLVERFGRSTQLSRIKRETDLIGKSHPNLVEIVDGGECSSTGYLFVAMTYLPDKNLAQVIRELPRSHIFPIIAQTASAAKFLEDNGIAHRDIKPGNICISDDFSFAKLLDLGVLRPVGLSDLTDEGEQRVFVGTLRYSPPELLYREEQDTLEGWRAVTFYQLGAVLHDMVMQYPLFHKYGKPYARLVDAVREEVPQILANDVEPRLLVLAKSCLVKNPAERLSLVSWNDFLLMLSSEEKGDILREKIMKKIGIVKGNIVEDKEEAKRSAARKRLLEFESIIDSIKETIRGICVSNTDCFPPFETITSKRVTETKYVIITCFGPSDRYSLGVALTLAIEVTRSGDPETIIELGSIAVASTACLADVSGGGIAAKLFFKGPYDHSFVKGTVQNLLLSLLDGGQDLSPEALIGPRVGNLENVLVLPL